MNRFLCALGALLLSGCVAIPDRTYVSANQDSRAQYLVIHFTSESFESSLETLTRGDGRVSSHYLVRDDPPTVYQLVDENRRAWHAGASSWLGQTQLNAASIGIEIVNQGLKGPPGEQKWDPYPEAQMEVVMALVRDIIRRHKIRPDRVIGHSDIAPQRKVDPGPLFPWKRLADEGLVVWPDANEVARRVPAMEAALPDVLWFQDRLAKHGFGVNRNGELDEATVRVIAAFQMKYRPARYDGMPDAETAAMLDVLTGP
ncbi:N-acetylmuramoyl-L-alanine amidase [Betaproteobacteria bacterium GR16-43]|nr:N-acetylmuramoyl-L-alanine amidase [Betaproteobacteria bacterium GR16-43]